RVPLVAAQATPETGTPEPGDLGSQLVLRVDIEGGFVPAVVNLTRTPVVAIYADGTVITTGPMIDIYPSPALPNLRKLTLSPSGREKVRAAAETAGLTEANRYDGANVTDMPDTVFTYAHGDETTVTAAYALGFDEETIADAAAKAARAKLLDLGAFIGDL